MKLLVFTQKVDKDDQVLGFFHSWVEKMSQRAETVTVICLSKGTYELPKNVTVYSLGKENRASKLSYVRNLYHYLGVIKGEYDTVFVHMNQEYVLLCGLYWKLKQIPVYLWRNHSKGSIFTQLAVLLSTKVFCTSEYSYTARFKKTKIMPAGIDTHIFKPVEGAVRMKYSVAMVGRISPVKRVDLALTAINKLLQEGGQVSFSIIGPTLENDKEYVASLHEYVRLNNLSTFVTFGEGVPMEKLPEIYSTCEVCLNLTDSGSFDKTIVEAASCGALPLVSNKAFLGKLPDVCITEDDPKTIAAAIGRLLNAREQLEVQKDLRTFVASQSLDSLMEKLFNEMN